jgi:5'-3' exonuclease
LRDALDANGITHLQAIAEAEELCSALCLEGRVHAVYSTDTDNIVRRCPILITDISYRDNGNDIMEMTASVTQYTNELPEALGLDYTGFVDLCILLGCDYNDGIPRWGLVKCFNEMSIHKNIESLIIAFPSIDFSKLNYDRCRQIFNLYHERSSKECCENQDAIDFI